MVFHHFAASFSLQTTMGADDNQMASYNTSYNTVPGHFIVFVKHWRLRLFASVSKFENTDHRKLISWLKLLSKLKTELLFVTESPETKSNKFRTLHVCCDRLERLGCLYFSNVACGAGDNLAAVVSAINNVAFRCSCECRLRPDFCSAAAHCTT